MSRITARTAALLAATPLMTAALASPADPASAARTELRVTIAPAARGAAAVSAVLTCEPAGGEHPYADRACANLANVDGDVARIPERSAPCLTYVDPVEISVVGTWRGGPVEYREYQPWGNAYCARYSHGFLFMIDLS